jgi:hypothetical protein
MPTISEIYDLLKPHRFRFGTELDLQDGIEAALTAANVEFLREHRLGTDPIDFLVAGGIGIECKIDGGPSAVIAQLVRYSQSPDVEALILATSRHTHRFNSGSIMAKPFRVLWVAGRSI